MKYDLAIYILPCGKDKVNPERAARSFENPGYTVVAEVLDHADLWRLNGTHYDHEWYGYIYSNEWIDETLTTAMPIYLRQYYFDSLVMCKKVIESGTERYFQMPRIFRNNIEIEEGKLLPRHDVNLRFERALDGWILENDR